MLAFEAASMQSDRRELMAVCSGYGDVAFVDFKYGVTSGYVRFKHDGSAAAAMEGLVESPVEVSGVVPTWRLMGDDEVDAYWTLTKQQRGLQAAASSTNEKAGKPVEAYGVVLLFEGAGQEADRAALGLVCSRHGEVAYIDFERGDASGYVRFKQPEAASVALEALAAEPADVGGACPSWRMLNREEEDAYKATVHSGGRKRQRDEGGAGDERAETQESGREASRTQAEEVVYGIVVHFDAVGGEASREDLNALCSRHGEVAFIDFQRGDTSGYVRFKEPEAASAALEALALEPADVGGACPSWRMLSRKEEDGYREAVQSRKRQRQEGGKGGKGKGKGKGRGGGRGAPRGWLGGRR